MLHQDCITGYNQLKQFDNAYVVKAKYYSLLVGYFKQLAAQNIISNADFDKYKKFLYTVCNTNNKLEQNIDFCAIDREITDVLANIIHQEQEILSFAHQQDHHNNQVSYNKSIEFDNILNHKFEETKQQILNKYSSALLNLTNERYQKHQVLEDNYATIKKQVDAEWNNYQNTHNAYINNLNDNKTTIEREFDNQEQQEKAKINDNYQTELQSIATSVKNILEKIDNDLNAQLKQLKHAVRASIVNLFTSITTAVAAYFSGGLLSGVSEYIEKSVQLSLTATSLGALENLVKDREKFGFTTIINFPRDQPIQDFKSEVKRNVATQNQQGSDFSANLAKLKEEFSIFNQQVHTWQTQAEHDLFYSLNQSIFVRPNFSNALAVYSAQTYKFNFGIEAELGRLQADGFRNIKWNINLDNNQWYGNYLMRDRNIRNIIHKITNNSSILNNNWQHPQRLSFNSSSSNWLTRFKQNYINVTTDIDDIDRLMYNYQSRVSSSKSRAADQENTISSSSSTISDIAKIPLALAALPFTLISSTAYASENTEGNGSNRNDPSSSSHARTSWLSKAHRAFKGERSLEILEWQNINRTSASGIAVGFDGISDGEKFCNTKLHTFKEALHERISDGLTDVNNRLRLQSLDLSVSDKFILVSKKLAFQSASSAVQHVVPGSTSEIREKVLSGVIGSELYFMYKLGEEFKIPGTNVKVAPLGNRKNDPIGKWPHYHRRVPDPKKPNESLPGQGRGRHRPWEVPVDKEGKSLDKKFTDRF